ncbi:MAG TPA: MFS transporter [Solirubrobacteraceae bacterium]
MSKHATDPELFGSAKAIVRWRNAIIAAFGMGGITVVSWGPRLPAIKAELGVGTGTIGLILACVTVGAIGGLLCSRFVLHSLGGRRAVMTTLLVVGVALAVMALGVAASSVAVLAAGFLMVGLGVGVLDVSINVEGAAVEIASGRTLMPLMHAAWSGGAAAGAGIGALCAAVGVKPAVQFAGLAVLVAAAGLVISRGIPLRPVQQAHAGDGERRSRTVRRWLRGWADRRLLLIGLVLFGVELGEGSANSWLSLAVKQNHGQSAGLAALFLSFFAVSEASARIVGGPLVDSFGRVRVLRGTIALGVAGITLFIVAGTIWLVACGVVLWAIGVSMGFPLGLSAAAEGEDPASQVSVASSIGYTANLLGPPVIGFLAESLGLLSSLWLLAFMFVAAFAAAGAVTPGAGRVRTDVDGRSAGGRTVEI